MSEAKCGARIRTSDVRCETHSQGIDCVVVVHNFPLIREQYSKVRITPGPGPRGIPVLHFCLTWQDFSLMFRTSAVNSCRDRRSGVVDGVTKWCALP